MSGDVERRALRLAVALASLSPLSVGLMGMTRGAAWLGGGSADLDSHVRYLSGLFFGLGLAALWCAQRIEARGMLLRAIALAVMLGGLARLAGLLGGGEPPSWPHRAALVLELGVTPALALWQARVARRVRDWRRG